MPLVKLSYNFENFVSYNMVEIKEKIINRVREINDESLLREILNVVEVESDLEEVYKLSETERIAVQEGIKEADKGLLIPHKEANQKVREWLKK